MNIVVPIKLVPDPAEELQIAGDGTGLDCEFLTFRVNEFCDHALEEALLLKEAHGGSVTVLAIERDETEKALFTALAKGADRAIRVTGLPDGAPTRAQAKAFCQALQGLQWDLVLAGVQAADDRDGQLPVLMAGFLGLPHVGVVSAVELQDGRLRILKEYAGGVMARFEVAPKAVLGIQAARQTPRYAPVTRVRQIQKEKQLDEFAADGVDVATGTTVRRMFTPERGAGAKMLEGTVDAVADRIIALLKEKRS
jgi:electron transfer flavoprotein beta subunit